MSRKGKMYANKGLKWDLNLKDSVIKDSLIKRRIQKHKKSIQFTLNSFFQFFSTLLMQKKLE